MPHRAVEILDKQYFTAQYRFIPPSPHLSEHVLSYWILDLRSPYFHQTAYEEILFANMYSSLVFNLGTPFEIYDQQGQLRHQCTRSVLIGYHTSTVSYRHTHNNYLIGIKFKPGALNYIFRIKGSDVIRQMIPAEDIIPCLFSLEAALYDAASGQQINTLLEQLLKSYTAPSGISRHFDQVLRCFKDPVLFQSNYQLQKLAALLCLTPRTLERYFAASLGLPPKKCLQVLRFRNALEPYLRQGYKADWEQLGYHDFSHFRKEMSHFYTKAFPTPH